jgi:hypothetical protein
MKKNTGNKKKITEEEDDEITRYRRELWVKSMHNFFEDIYREACKQTGGKR